MTDFQVFVVRPDQDPVDVTDAVMSTYDIAVTSMDFGSGFLDTEEVGKLRELGKAIGAERFDYQHDKCLRCGHDYERHTRKLGCGTCDPTYGQDGKPLKCPEYIRPAE